MFLPAGVSVIKASANGKPATRRVYVDATTAARLQADLETMQAAADANQKARPCGMFDHKAGKASFLPKRFWWLDGRGVMLDVEWTKAGREAVEGRDYSYFSPTFKLRDGVVTGLDERVEIGSLVNSPAFESMERIAAARTDDDLPEDGSEVVLCGEVDTLETLEARKADIERRIDELKDGGHAPKSAPKNGQDDDDEAADDAKTDARHDDGGDLSPMKKAHLAVLKRMDGEQRVKEGKKGGALDGVMARVRHAAACAGCEPAIKGARELVQAANPYGCNQFGHGFKAEHKGYGAGGQKTLDLGNTVDKERAKEAKEIERMKKDAVDKARKAREAGMKWDSIDWRDDEGNRKAREEFNEASRKADKAKEDLLNKRGERQRKEYEAAPKRGDERNVKENMGGGNKSWQRQSKVRKAIQSGDDDAAEKAVAEVIEDAKKDGDETGARFWKEMLDSMRQEREGKKRMKEVLERAHRRNSDNVKSSKP